QVEGLEVKDFTTSWRDGMAFNAMIHAIRPELVNLRAVQQMDVRQRLENAFSTAEERMGIPRLIDAEDVDVPKPDEKSIMTYIAQFSRKYPDEPSGALNREHGELLRWINESQHRLQIVNQAITDIQAEYKDYIKYEKECNEKHKQFKNFERKESKSTTFPAEKLKELKDSFDDIIDRVKKWRIKLDTSLPGELGQIGQWINDAESLLEKDLPFDPETLSPEGNYKNYSILKDEHARFFNNKDLIQQSFLRIKRDSSIVGQHISQEHLNNLNGRLTAIMQNSEEREHYLNFEETRWKLQCLLTPFDQLLKTLNQKQGNIDETARRLNELKIMVHGDKIIQTIEHIMPDLHSKAQQYHQLSKKDDRKKEFITFTEQVRKRMKSAVTDLTSKETLLEETMENWNTYYSCIEPFEKWLNEGEQVLRRSSEEKTAYFSNVENWRQFHLKLNKAIQFLLSVCDDDNGTMLKNKLLLINRRWKDIDDSVKQYHHDEVIKKKRDEFYAGRAKLLETLEKIEREIQDSLPCTLKAIKEQDHRLYNAQAEIETFQRTLQILIKLGQTIDRESGDQHHPGEMISLLQVCQDKLSKIEHDLPLISKRNKTIHTQLQKFEDGMDKFTQWLNDGKQTIHQYTLQVPVKKIETFLEQHRNFFTETAYYRSMIESKGKLLTDLKKSNVGTQINFNMIDEQYNQMLIEFEQICQEASYWDKQFSLHTELWRNFHHRLKLLEDWIEKAQDIVKEKNDDYAWLIRKHKDFFDNADDEILHGFVNSGQELLHIRSENDQKDIKHLMDTLETKWK
ncbi:unnamed protein product, partial [Didymodactylos carnosus]